MVLVPIGLGLRRPESVEGLFPHYFLALVLLEVASNFGRASSSRLSCQGMTSSHTDRGFYVPALAAGTGVGF
jgi:hypothetical protein